jgi:hypothetical protein
MLFSAGDCPVCSLTGEILFVKDRVSGRVFSYCPLCGCAWTTPPPPVTLDSIEGLDTFAPEGIELPTRLDIATAGLEHMIRREPDFEEWGEILNDVMAPGRK